MTETSPNEDRPGPEHMGEAESWEHLTGAQVCRLAFPLDGRTELVPANFVAIEQRLLFRTVPGSVIQRAAGASVVFEVDGWTEHDAWSVVVRGPLQPVEDGDRIRQADAVGLDPWPTREQPASVLLEVVPLEVQGRRFGRRAQPGMLWSW
ncbi:MAG TPA: pyridoxamine 5'-phosphate oxidase family protein [Amnibacterium sp.]|nr:pyridoxamine 5'-phosphate oxidase family protein [Amnibacterium sp.]